MAEATSQDWDYFKVEEAYGLLEKSEHGKERDAIKQVLDSYRQSNVHMAEAAQALAQLVRIDLPSAKDQVQSFQKQVQDIERKQRDVTQEDVDAKRKFREMCDAHQIAGNDFVPELRSVLATTVPQILERAASKIATTCPELLTFYCAFSKSLHEGAGPADDAMPLLRFVIANGNASLKDAANLSDELKSEWQDLCRNKDAESIKFLANTFARGLVLTDLLELQTFLSERIRELEQRGTEEIPMSAEISLQDTKAFYEGISEAIAAVHGKDVAPLLLMNSSEAMLSHEATRLSTQRSLCNRLASKLTALEQSKAELSAEAGLHVAAAERLQAQCQHLQSWLEEELSRMMKYKVCLVGEVANI